MSIQSTQTITRTKAINRITKMVSLANDGNYLEIENNTFEPNYKLGYQTVKDMKLDISDIDKWTNSMLEDVMDCPFFRFSMFDNYFVTSKEV